MKFLLLFFTVIYPIFKTCYGRNINQLHVVFVSNVVDPNDYEMETFNELVSYPFVKMANSSLMSPFGLVVNYSMIFSSNPDNIITQRGLDMDRYSTYYFETIINNQTTNSCKGKSLKGLKKALEITTGYSIILMAANRKPTDAGMLMDLLEVMVDKKIPVIVFQIDDDGSISELPNLNINELDGNYYIPKNLKRNKKPLVHEFSLIMKISAALMIEEAKSAKSDALQVPNSGRYFVFVIGITRPTKEDLDEISQSMEKFAQLDNKPYHVVDSFSFMFLENGHHITINKYPFHPYKYDTNYFHSFLKDYLVNSTIREPTLKGLRNSLKIVTPYPWIVYYVKNLPIDDHLLLPEITQLINDKKAQVKISIHGRNDSRRKTVPVLYRTILDASKMATSSLNETTNWIEAEYFPRKISNRVESSTVTSKETTPLVQKPKGNMTG